MKSLYNIAGILPAQSRSNPSDFGIAWSDHKRTAKRESTIQAGSSHLKQMLDPAPQKPDATEECLTLINPATINVGDTVRFVSPLNTSFTEGRDYAVVAVDRQDVNGPVRLVGDDGEKYWPLNESLRLVAKKPNVTGEILTPINPSTIQVGDTVRLVGSKTVTEFSNACDLKVGKDYKVLYVDRECSEGMSISVSYNRDGRYFWIYDEDLMLVESA